MGRVPLPGQHGRPAARPESPVWEMRPDLQLAELPRGSALDSELIAFDDDGKPSFPASANGCSGGSAGPAST